MGRVKNQQRILMVLVCALLGAGISILLQVFVLQEEALVYSSAGKLNVTSSVHKNASALLQKAELAEFSDAAMDLLVSEEMQMRAFDRACLANPALVPCEVRTRISHLKDSPFFSIIATGKEPEFTRCLLDALMEEFIASRMEASPEISDTSVIVEHASPAAKVLGDWQEPALSGATTGGLAGLAAGLLLAWTFVRPEIDASSLPSEQEPAPVLKGTQSAFMKQYGGLVWGVGLGLASCVLIQIVRLTNRPQEFRSLAKVVAVQGLNAKEISSPQVSHDYYGTIIETLESGQVHSKALKRVKTLNPEIKVRDVEIRAAQTKGSAIFNVLATSTEPKFTRIFLDALLDEFVILRTRQIEEAGLNPRDDVLIQERATPALENIEDWSMPLYVGATVGAFLGGLLGLLQMLLKSSARHLTSAPTP